MTSTRRDILISGADVVGSGRADIAVKDGTIVAVGPGAADALTDPRRIGAARPRPLYTSDAADAKARGRSRRQLPIAP